MSDPTLLVVAGCNGSGKSSYANLVPLGFKPFDYDAHFLACYKSLLDIDIKEQMAHNIAFNELTGQIEAAISDKSNFCYETNFDSDPLHWPQLFREKGYKLSLIYLCLDTIDQAMSRVAIRVANGGHFVSDSEIKRRYVDGFKNINQHFRYFDEIDFFDTSGHGEMPKHIITVNSGVITLSGCIPHYLNDLVPDIIAA